MLEPPLPVSATYQLSTDQLRVVFDQLLNDGGVPPIGPSWAGRFAAPPNLAFAGLGVGTILGNQITVLCARGGAVGPPSVVNYADAPPDVFGPRGAGVVAFTAFPLTEIP